MTKSTLDNELSKRDTVPMKNHTNTKTPRFESRSFRDSKRTPSAKVKTVTRKHQRHLKADNRAGNR